MMRFNTVLVVAFVIASLAIKNTQAAYRRLNRYLTNQVNNDRVYTNLNAAARWLNEQEGKRFSFFSLVPISDLKKFTALQQVIDDNECDGTSYDIMRSNGAFHLKSDGKSLRRVDKVILQIFKNHAMRCQTVYPINFRKKYKRMKSEMNDLVVNLVRILTEGDRFISMPERNYYNPENLFNDYVENPVTIRRYLGRRVIRVALLDNAKNDPNVRYLEVPEGFKSLVDYKVDKDRIKLLLRKYIIEPCLYYVGELGPDLFTPARLDAKFFNTVQKSHRDYYLSWKNFMVCRTLTDNDELVLSDLVNDLNKAIVAKLSYTW